MREQFRVLFFSCRTFTSVQTKPWWHEWTMLKHGHLYISNFLFLFVWEIAMFFFFFIKNWNNVCLLSFWYWQICGSVLLQLCILDFLCFTIHNFITGLLTNWNPFLFCVLSWTTCWKALIVPGVNQETAEFRGIACAIIAQWRVSPKCASIFQGIIQKFSWNINAACKESFSMIIWVF